MIISVTTDNLFAEDACFSVPIKERKIKLKKKNLVLLSVIAELNRRLLFPPLPTLVSQPSFLICTKSTKLRY